MHLFLILFFFYSSKALWLVVNEAQYMRDYTYHEVLYVI